jgi:molecular chaperone DnaJ
MGYEGRPRARRGRDLRYDVEISLENAYRGLNTEISVPRAEECDSCNGSGAKSGTKPKQCSQCNGTGQIRQSRRTAFGMFTQIGTCPRCRGQGKIIEERCPKCGGVGRVQKTRSIEIKIPKGIDDRSQLRLGGQGEMGEGGSGDLYVVVHLKKHPRFNRRGLDIHTIKDLSFPDAALGTKVEIETLDGGMEKLKIPDGTQNGEIFKIKGKGMPSVHGRGHGDLFVEVQVKTPSRLSRKARKLIEDLQDELKDN